MTAIITLTTDFGMSNPFVGIMKGVILSIAPHARLVDLTHEIPPGDILAAALTIEAAIHYFPRETIHLAVVDPGVGTTRKPIAIHHHNQYFVGPDNGLFALILSNDNNSLIKSPQTTRIIHLNNEHYFRKPVSSSFHGRDIFAPVAANLALGADINEFGSAIEDYHPLSFPPLIHEDESTITAEVIAVDHFGNLITNCKIEDLEPYQPNTTRLTINISPNSPYCNNHHDSPEMITIPRLSRTFAEVAPDEPLAYFGSTGRLEIALRNANAAQQFAIGPGSRFHITWSTQTNTDLSS